MNVTPDMRRLESVGFAEETLWRAVAAAGADRRVYQALYQAVEKQGLAPEEALRTIEQTSGPR